MLVFDKKRDAFLDLMSANGMTEHEIAKEPCVSEDVVHKFFILNN